MSMHPQPVGTVPQDTARVAKAAFPKGNLYLHMRDVLDIIYDDEDFSELFEVRGRRAITPWRLALVTVMQFSEGLSDRQAAEAVRARIDWKYTLGLQLSDPGFNFSVLSEFRSRLVEGGKERLLLQKLLEGCKERGFLKVRGMQRTDSTHVLGSLPQRLPPEDLGHEGGSRRALSPEGEGLELLPLAVGAKETGRESALRGGPGSLRPRGLNPQGRRSGEGSWHEWHL